MRITNKIEIARSAAEVWQVLYHEFHEGHSWIGAVKSSYSLPKGQGEGRVCHFTDEADQGFSAVEKIIYVDRNRKQFSFEGTLFNAPLLTPFDGNRANIEVEELGPNRCSVYWEVTLDLKLFAVPFSPLLRYQFRTSFQEVLEELKAYMEQKQAV